MTIRELKAMLLLYRACDDAVVRAQVLTLVPDLADLATVVVPFSDELRKTYPPPRPAPSDPIRKG